MNEKIETIQKLVLERVKLAAMTQFTQEIVDYVEVKQIADMVSKDLWAAMLQLLIPAKATKKSYVMGSEEVPLTWWDHLKARLGLRHKTREIEAVIEETHYHMCPHIEFGFRGAEERKRHMQWLHYAGEDQRLRHDFWVASERAIEESDDNG